MVAFGARCDRVPTIDDDFIKGKSVDFKKDNESLLKYKMYHGLLKKLPNRCPKFSLASGNKVSIHDIASRVSSIPQEYSSTEETYWVVA